MSHFTVMVVTEQEPTEAVLGAALLPFHEYECTGIEAYLEFVPFEDFDADYAEHGNGRTRADFAYEWHGTHAECENGVWGRQTNPNKKWDWWAIGGRWPNMLHTKSGERGNTARRGDLDLESMAREQRENRARQWADFERDVRHGNEASARFLYGIPKGVDRDAFINAARFSTFAVLWKGEWYEKGRMLWFAVVADEREDWPQAFQRILADIPADNWLTIVDCHI